MDFDAINAENPAQEEQLTKAGTEDVNVGINVELPTQRGESITVFDVFYANSMSRFYALFLVIFAVIFSTADINSGYIKNIGGQVKNRGALIVSRAAALAVFTFITMAGVFLLQAVSNFIYFREVEWGNLNAFLAYFFTESALHYALVLICMAIAVILKNNVISMVISICITMNLMSLVYYLIDRLIDKVGIHNFVISKYTVTGRIAMLGMEPGGRECLVSLAVAVIFGIVVTTLGSVIFRKGIFKMYIVIGILAGIIILQAIILWKHVRQVKDICRQLSFQMKQDSNMLISRELDFGGIGRLVDLLNELLDMRRKERRSYLEKEALIADTYTNLSHDIRTPLTSLDGYFQLMEDCENVDDQRRYLGIIHERIRSLNEMLEELFTFTKLKNDSYSLNLTPCCLNRILKETVFHIMMTG